MKFINITRVIGCFPERNEDQSNNGEKPNVTKVETITINTDNIISVKAVHDEQIPFNIKYYTFLSLKASVVGFSNIYVLESKADIDKMLNTSFTDRNAENQNEPWWDRFGF